MILVPVEAAKNINTAVEITDTIKSSINYIKTHTNATSISIISGVYYNLITEFEGRT